LAYVAPHRGPWSSGYDICLTCRKSPVRIRLGPLTVLSRQLFSDSNSIGFLRDSWLVFKDAVVCVIDTRVREVSPGAAIVPLRRHYRCVSHASRYLLKGYAVIERDLAARGSEVIPLGGYSRLGDDLILEACEPLLFVTLPEMPFWKDIVPFSAELVEDEGRNPLRSTPKRSQCNHFFGQSEGD
jgi:hypothetical protein